MNVMARKKKYTGRCKAVSQPHTLKHSRTHTHAHTLTPVARGSESIPVFSKPDSQLITTRCCQSLSAGRKSHTGIITNYHIFL